MPTLKKINAILGTSYTRSKQLYADVQQLQEKAALAGEAPPAAPAGIIPVLVPGIDHDLEVVWISESASLGEDDTGKRWLWVEGHVTGDVINGRIYLAQEKLVFLPRNLRKVSRQGSSRGLVAVNGHIAGECTMAYAPAAEWPDHTEPDDTAFIRDDLVLQAKVALSREDQQRIAGAICVVL